jgi:hypothetical protein
MIYLYGGPLPWHKISSDIDKESRYRKIVEIKLETTVEQIIKDNMPCKLHFNLFIVEFMMFLIYCKEL